LEKVKKEISIVKLIDEYINPVTSLNSFVQLGNKCKVRRSNREGKSRY